MRIEMHWLVYVIDFMLIETPWQWFSLIDLMLIIMPLHLFIASIFCWLKRLHVHLMWNVLLSIYCVSAMLIETCWRWFDLMPLETPRNWSDLMLIETPWFDLMLIETPWFDLMLIETPWFDLMLIETPWFDLMLIETPWYWFDLMLIETPWHTRELISARNT